MTIRHLFLNLGNPSHALYKFTQNEIFRFTKYCLDKLFDWYSKIFYVYEIVNNLSTFIMFMCLIKVAILVIINYF